LQVHLNGRLVEDGQALISAFDRGFLFGDGIFESMRVLSGRIFRLDRHLERLRRSALLIGLDLPDDGAGIATAAIEVIRANGLGDARLRVTVTRGPGRPGDYLDAPGPPTVVVAAHPFAGLEAALHEKGVRVVLSKRPQVPAEVLDPAIKSISRLSSVLARREARDRGAFEALLRDADGHLTEGTVSNIFIAEEGRLRTPATPAGCLPGVTRQAVIELARGIGLEVAEERLPVGALRAATELFLTNSSWDVLPVVAIDDRTVADGRPGPLARDLLTRYRALLRAECGGD